MGKSFKISIGVIIALLLSFLTINHSITNKELAVSKDDKVTMENKLTPIKSDKVSNYNYYVYDATKDGFKSIRSDVTLPKYYIFAGNKTEEAANKLVNELNILPNVQQWAGQVYVINPISGQSYNDADKEAFIDLVGGAISNIKVIGIDEGATFVNNDISQSCYFIAGIMTYGGEINKGLQKNDVVPVYLSNPSKDAIDFYKNINEATEKKKKGSLIVYLNKILPLQRVVVTSKKESLEKAFKNAWDNVFSQNYRQHNSLAEFYMLDARRATSNYDLIRIPEFDELGIAYNQQIDDKVTGMSGKYTWFEYVPKTVKTSKTKTVPLVVTLHGNLNDPRLQGDTTGWPELAAKENFIVVAPEWQQGDNFFECEGLGGDGVVKLIKNLQLKYPQIDPSRIYVSGLSLGGAESFLLGLKYSDIFAAIGINSGVNVFATEVTEIANNYSNGDIPLLYLCGDRDFFQMIPVDGSSKFGTQYLFGKQIWDEDQNVHIFSSLQAYQKVNGLEVSEMNMNSNEYYGIKLDDQKWIKLGDKDMFTGTLSNDKGVIMELGAIKDLAHWNYKPEAEYIWNFFNRYSRNTETGELNIHK